MGAASLSLLTKDALFKNSWFMCVNNSFYQLYWHVDSNCHSIKAAFKQTDYSSASVFFSSCLAVSSHCAILEFLGLPYGTLILYKAKCKKTFDLPPGQQKQFKGHQSKYIWVHLKFEKGMLYRNILLWDNGTQSNTFWFFWTQTTQAYHNKTVAHFTVQSPLCCPASLPISVSFRVIWPFANANNKLILLWSAF